MPFIPEDNMDEIRAVVQHERQDKEKYKALAAARLKQARDNAPKLIGTAETVGGAALGGALRARLGDADGNMHAFGIPIPPDGVAGAVVLGVGLCLGGKMTDHVLQVGNGLLASFSSHVVCNWMNKKEAEAAAAAASAPPPAKVSGSEYYGAVGASATPELLGPIPAYGGPATYHRPSYRVGGGMGPMTDAELAAYAASHY